MKLTKTLLYNFRFFIFSLLLISLSFHSLPLTSITLALFFLLGLTNIKNFWKAPNHLRIFSSFGLLYFCSSLVSHLLYDEELMNSHFTKTFFFLIIPLSFQLSHDMLSYEKIKKAIFYYCLSVIIFSLLGVLKVFYLFKIQLVSTVFYESLGEVLKIHTTYFSLIVCIAYLFVIQELVKCKQLKSSICYLIVSIYLLIIVFLLSSRIGIIAIVIVSLFVVINNWKNIPKKKLIVFSIFFLTLIISFISFGHSSTRINNSIHKNQANKSDTENRILLWKNVWCAFENSPNKLLGAGLEDNQDILNECYKKSNFFGFKSNYNAHNQYLQTLLENGFLGALLLYSFFIIIGIISFKNKIFILQNLVIIFSLFFFTESILERQLGITTFLIFIPLAFPFKNEN
jgi:O-antigen ligase